MILIAGQITYLELGVASPDSASRKYPSETNETTPVQKLPQQQSYTTPSQARERAGAGFESLG